MAHTTQYDDRESVQEAMKDTTGRMLPWAVSLLMHAGLVLLAVFLVWSTLAPPVAEERVTVSDFDAPYKVFVPPIERLPDATKRPPAADRFSSRSLSPVAPVAPTSHKPADIHGIGALPVRGDYLPVDGTKPTIFTDPPLEIAADRIAYVIDASGSVSDTLPFALAELSQAILHLADDKQFTVIFFQGTLDGRQRVVEVPGGMQMATMENKARVINWIDPAAGHVVPVGKTNPVEALKLAMARNAQLIHLLSDNITGRGIYELSQADLMIQIRRMNRNGAIISTIQYVYPDPLATTPGMRSTMQLIAEETRGTYRFVSGASLFLE